MKAEGRPGYGEKDNKGMPPAAGYPQDDPSQFTIRRPRRRAARGTLGLRIVMLCLALAALLLIGDRILSWSREFGDGAERTSDSTPIPITIGADRLAIPANFFRFASQRTAEPQEQVDLVLHWPSLEGYSRARREVFLQGGEDAPLLFLTLRTRQGESDSATRFLSLYQHLMEETPLDAPAGLLGRRLGTQSGIEGEEVYFEPVPRDPFVVHCLTAIEDRYPPLCLSDFRAGRTLIVQLRFRKGLLNDWAAIKAASRRLLLGFGVVS